MAWQSIGEGERADMSMLQLHPIHREPPPVFPTYRVIMDALKSILDPINERLDPSYKLKQQELAMRREQLAEYMSPQAKQMRQREQAMKGQMLDLQGQKLGIEAQVAGPEGKVRTAKARAMNAAIDKYNENPDESNLIFKPDGTFGEADAGTQIARKAAKFHSQQQAPLPAAAPPSPRKTTSLESEKPIRISPYPDTAAEIPVESGLATDEQMANTPQGIVVPPFAPAPEIMEDDSQWT